jgi:hypothetical protein
LPLRLLVLCFCHCLLHLWTALLLLLLPPPPLLLLLLPPLLLPRFLCF